MSPCGGSAARAFAFRGSHNRRGAEAQSWSRSLRLCVSSGYRNAYHDDGLVAKRRMLGPSDLASASLFPAMTQGAIIERRQMKPRTRKEMITFLRDHFRYNTMNSWNRSKSYARNIKIHNLEGLDAAEHRRAYEMLDVEEAFYGFKHELAEFQLRHKHSWQIGTNGRSGGYLVLYQGGRRATDYKSVCAACGQLNFATVVTGDQKCGRCGADERENLESPRYEVFTYPGKGLDMDDDFETWSTYQLKERVALVWDFDKTCERAVQAFIAFAKSHIVEEQIVMVPKTITVAVKA
jgi:hypothetical protein